MKLYYSQNTRQERGQRKGGNRTSHREEKTIGGKRRRQAEQSGASCDKAKRGIDHVSVDGISQLPRITYGMAVDGTHGVGRALDVLSVYDRLGCDIIGLQETRPSGHSAFS